MGFKQNEVDKLLSDTGRMCCLCGVRHKVQVHHIIPTKKGGKDDIDNAIPLCPNCHDEVHRPFGAGVTTRTYSTKELKLHRQRTIDLCKRQKNWTPGNDLYDQDKQLIIFYSQCLDRPAFRTHFHQELSFSAFDKAMEDTVLALCTGYWRTRDGAVIDRAKGKSHIVSPKWREAIDKICDLIQEVRYEFHQILGFNDMLFQMDRSYQSPDFGKHLRTNRPLGKVIDDKRNAAIKIMNSILKEIGKKNLKEIEKW